MNLTLELLYSLCLFNVQAKDLAACRVLSNATVLTYKSELAQVDKIERDIASKIPNNLKITVNIVSALQSGNIYVPLINKEW